MECGHVTYIPQDTLAYYLDIPQVRKTDLSMRPNPGIAAGVKKARGYFNSVTPDEEAIEFYCLNHLVSLVRAKFHPLEPLPLWAQQVARAYANVLGKQCTRMFSYLYLISHREARHASMTPTQLKKAGLSEGLVKYLEKVHGEGSEYAATKAVDTPAAGPVGAHVRGLVSVFSTGGFSPGFGGLPWAKVAETLAAAIEGLTTLEMLVDSAYSLAHNNGPIFNKGMLYAMYTSEFIKILDVQRSGQIPEMVISATPWQGEFKLSGTNIRISNSLVAEVANVKTIFQNAFGTKVDWKKVNDLGSVQSYTDEGVTSGKKNKKKPASPKPATVPEWMTYHPSSKGSAVSKPIKVHTVIPLLPNEYVIAGAR